MKVTDNHEATIWLGLREGYTNRYMAIHEISSESKTGVPKKNNVYL